MPSHELFLRASESREYTNMSNMRSALLHGLTQTESCVRHYYLSLPETDREPAVARVEIRRFNVPLQKVREGRLTVE